MKQILLALALILPCVAFAQTDTNTPASAGAPHKKLPEPISSTTPDNTRYLNSPQLLVGRIKSDVANIHGKPCDIIFVGDSITYNWQGSGEAIWQKEYVPRHALDFGIGGDKTQNVLWRLDNMPVKDLRPKVAVVMIGTNNLKNQPQEIADGIKAVLDKTQATFPGVKIILVSILPNRRANDKMMAVDAIIKNDADNQSIFCLDLVPLMPPVTTTTPDGKTDTNYKGLGKDHLHPDASGYQIWADAMEPLLAKLLPGQ